MVKPRKFLRMVSTKENRGRFTFSNIASPIAVLLLLLLQQLSGCTGLLLSKREALVPQLLHHQDYKSIHLTGSTHPLFVSAGLTPEEDVPRPKPRPVMEPPSATETGELCQYEFQLYRMLENTVAHFEKMVRLRGNVKYLKRFLLHQNRCLQRSSY